MEVMKYQEKINQLAKAMARRTGLEREDLRQEFYVKLLPMELSPEQDNWRFIATMLYRCAYDCFRSRNYAYSWGNKYQRAPLDDWRLRASDHSTISLEVKDILTRLEPADQKVLMLCYIEGYTHKEIADILGCSRSLVTRRISNARERFKKEVNCVYKNQVYR